jgi:branched-chain amino acid transport system substrate-binding protein
MIVPLTLPRRLSHERQDTEGVRNEQVIRSLYALAEGNAKDTSKFLSTFTDRAIDEVGLEPKMVGGAMIGPQNGSIKAQLGPLLNGLVNYEYWLPVPKMMFPGVAEMIADYQSLAQDAGADPLGYYVAPQAYAQMQIVEQAIAGTGSLNDAKLAQFTRGSSFKTVVGDVKFGKGGGWSEAHVLQVQYQTIKNADLSEFKDARTQTVVWPSNLASGALLYPYAEAKRNIKA